MDERMLEAYTTLGYLAARTEAVRRHETRERLQDAIDGLPANQRAVISLRDVEGWSSDEVCNALEITETNQRVLLRRATARVRRARWRSTWERIHSGADVSGAGRARHRLLDGAMPAADVRRFDEHLTICDGCTTYLDQFRKTIDLAGRLTTESVDPATEEALLSAFRGWKTGR